MIAGTWTSSSYTTPQKLACKYDSQGNRTILDPPLNSFNTPFFSGGLCGDLAAVFFGGGVSTGSLVTEVYIPDTKKSIPLPAFNKYKFQEHAAEQPYFDYDTNIIVNAPNSGYFKQEKGAKTL